MKKVLAISYSQSGQLHQIVNQFLSPFQTHCEVDVVTVKLKNDFPFPWTVYQFFDAMPETVAGIPPEIETPKFKHETYDLVVFAYQPWFLHPSAPSWAILTHPTFEQRIKDTPVITVSGGRNMWLNAQEKVKAQLLQSNAQLVANLPLVDRHTNLISAVTIMHWMFSGNKTRKWNLFPKPGVAEKDITESKFFGEMAKNAMVMGDFNQLQAKYVQTGKIRISTAIMFIEQRAPKIFRIWSKLILSKPEKRKFLVNFFKVYLIIALFVVAPILLTLYYILILPFTQKAVKTKKKYFCDIELKQNA